MRVPELGSVEFYGSAAGDPLAYIKVSIVVGGEPMGAIELPGHEVFVGDIRIILEIFHARVFAQIADKLV